MVVWGHTHQHESIASRRLSSSQLSVEFRPLGAPVSFPRFLCVSASVRVINRPNKPLHPRIHGSVLYLHEKEFKSVLNLEITDLEPRLMRCFNCLNENSHYKINKKNRKECHDQPGDRQPARD